MRCFKAAAIPVAALNTINAVPCQGISLFSHQPVYYFQLNNFVCIKVFTLVIQPRGEGTVLLDNPECQAP